MTLASMGCGFGSPLTCAFHSERDAVDRKQQNIVGFGIRVSKEPLLDVVERVHVRVSQVSGSVLKY